MELLQFLHQTNSSASVIEDFVGRKYQVYSEVESEPLCDSSGSISAFTFLNFVAASVSLAGLLASNTNSNNNNNNQNNNDNNNNDNNINIGNNNNNVNNNNMLMLLPMVGRRSTLGNHIHASVTDQICDRDSQGTKFVIKPHLKD